MGHGSKAAPCVCVCVCVRVAACCVGVDTASCRAPPSNAQGFLPSEWDPFFRDVLYPSFSPQMLLFLGMSSAYGLWKTGK